MSLNNNTCRSTERVIDNQSQSTIHECFIVLAECLKLLSFYRRMPSLLLHSDQILPGQSFACQPVEQYGNRYKDSIMIFMFKCFLHFFLSEDTKTKNGINRTYTNSYTTYSLPPMIYATTSLIACVGLINSGDEKILMSFISREV